MLAEDFVKRCAESGIHLRLDDGELKFRAAKGAMTDETRQHIKERKAEIIEFLQHQPVHAEDDAFRLRKAAADQCGLIFDHAQWLDYPNLLMEIGVSNAPYIAIRFHRPIQADVMKKAIRALLERHDVLSATIEKSDGKLLIKRRPVQEPDLQEIQTVAGTHALSYEKALPAANSLVWQDYDLDSGRLYKVFILKISEAESIFYLGIHHSVCDGLSIGIAFHEILALYGSILAGAPSPLPPLKAGYVDFLVSMNRWLASPRGKAALEYWVETISSSPQTCLQMRKFDCQQNAVTSEIGEVEFKLDAATASRLVAVASQLKTTLFTLLLVAQKAAIWLTTGLAEPVIVVISGLRINHDLQLSIGNFASEVAYKTNLSGDPTLLEALSRLQKTIAEAERNQPIPFDVVRRTLRERGIDFSAPTVGFLPAENVDDPLPPLSDQPQRIRFQRPAPLAGFPGTYGIQFRGSEHGVTGEMLYRKEFYDEQSVNEYCKAVRIIIDALIETPEIRLSAVTLDGAHQKS